MERICEMITKGILDSENMNGVDQSIAGTGEMSKPRISLFLGRYLPIILRMSQQGYCQIRASQSALKYQSTLFTSRSKH